VNRLRFFCFAFASIFAAGSALIACRSTVTCQGGACGSSAGGGGAGGAGAGGQSGAIIFASDPLTLTLRLTSFSLSCNNADQDPPFGQCDWYTFDVTFPASMLTPGPLDTSNPAVTFFFQSSGKPNSPTPGDCPGTGGGGFPVGMLSFTKVDATSVIVDVSGVSSSLLDDHDVNGSHTAARCP